MTHKIRQATIEDIPEMQQVRNSVIENVLSEPSKVTNQLVEEYITSRGRGWVCEAGNIITGFSIVDLKEDNVWALFVRPEFEGKGLGKELHQQMLDWFFAQGKQKIWLSTEPNTRAAAFYRSQGWKEIGKHGSDEIKFELTAREWEQKK